jgi:hypothetical protein
VALGIHQRTFKGGKGDGQEVAHPVMFGLAERGKLVAYAERLPEPRFQPEQPLRPASKYLWSVRLRKDDAVSTWSTTSFSAFMFGGWTNSAGYWFGFTTSDR